MVKLFKFMKCFCLSCLLQLPISYTAFTSRHVVNIFQTEHLSALKFHMGCEEKKTLSFETKISQSLRKKKKKKKKTELGSFKRKGQKFQAKGLVKRIQS